MTFIKPVSLIGLGPNLPNYIIAFLITFQAKRNQNFNFDGPLVTLFHTTVFTEREDQMNAWQGN